MFSWRKRLGLAFGLFSALLIVATLLYLGAHRNSVSQLRINVAEQLTAVIAFSFLASLLVYRRPNNLISWLLLGVAFLQLATLIDLAVKISLFEGAELTAGLAFWGTLWDRSGGVTYVLLAYLFVIFPEGRLPSPRWRWSTWLLGGFILMTAGLVIFTTYDASRALRIAESNGSELTLVPVADGLTVMHVRQIPELAVPYYVLMASSLIMVLLGLWSQVIRFRRGGFVARQQSKWAIFVMAIWAAGLIPFFLLLDLRPFLVTLLRPLLPTAIAVPILRYRLYDIDLIIRRTLVYALLTSLLALIYFGLVSILQYTVLWMIGETSPVVIVISTLIIAALFAPIRRWVQRFIDLRFFRRKYDAQQVMAQFTEAVQHEVDMQQLTTDLINLVDKTMRPESISIWLKDR